MRYNIDSYKGTDETKFDDFVKSFNWMVDVAILGRSNGYQERRVGRDEVGIVTIDTARVPDRTWTYETAIGNDNDWVIVEGCDDLEDAKKMHQEWVEQVKRWRNDDCCDAVAVYDISSGEEEEVKIR